MTYSALKKTASSMNIHVPRVRGKIRLEEERYRATNFGYAANCHDLPMAERYIQFYAQQRRFPNNKQLIGDKHVD